MCVWVGGGAHRGPILIGQLAGAANAYAPEALAHDRRPCIHGDARDDAHGNTLQSFSGVEAVTQLTEDSFKDEPPLTPITAHVYASFARMHGESVGEALAR